MNVLFLTLYPQNVASSRYRIHQWVPGLEEAGIKCEIRSALSDDEYAALQGKWKRYHWLEATRRRKQLNDVGDFDLVVLQKGITSPGLRGFWGQLRGRARKVIFDVDDAVHLRQPVQLGWPWKWCCDGGQIEKIMRESDVVWSGNRWLCEQVKNIGGTPLYMPTCVDTSKFTENTNKLDDLVLGWMGNPSTSGTLKIFSSILNDSKQIPLRIVGSPDGFCPVPHATYHPWSLDSEVEEMTKISVGLMPLENNEWNRGKCALKALLYMAVGIPCIASSYGVVNDIIDHKVNGLLVGNEKELGEALEYMRDRVVRATLGEAARETVVKKYSVSTWLPNMIQSLQEAGAAS